MDCLSLFLVWIDGMSLCSVRKYFWSVCQQCGSMQRPFTTCRQSNVHIFEWFWTLLLNNTRVAQLCSTTNYKDTNCRDPVTTIRYIMRQHEIHKMRDIIRRGYRYLTRSSWIYCVLLNFMLGTCGCYRNGILRVGGLVCLRWYKTRCLTSDSHFFRSLRHICHKYGAFHLYLVNTVFSNCQHHIKKLLSCTCVLRPLMSHQIRFTTECFGT